MSLVPDYDDSASSTTENDSSPEENSEPIQIKAQLPKPNFHNASAKSDQTGSVFANPFAEAENAKEAVLEKHVKMVDAKSNVVVINGKKICWNYRKGRCRFGHNCKFAHDSDLQGQAASNEQVADNSRISEVKQPGEAGRKRKKRPGLTQGLIPGKRVMKKYTSQKL